MNVKLAKAVITALLFALSTQGAQGAAVEQLIRSDTTGVTGGENTPDHRDPYRRETPRSMLIGIVSGLLAKDFLTLSQYPELDTNQTLSEEERAREFRRGLDNYGRFFPSLKVSNAPEGNINDGLPPDYEAVGKSEINGKTFPIVARRTINEDGQEIWRISSDSVARLSTEAVRSSSNKPSDKGLRIFDAPLQQWLIIIGSGFFFYFLVRIGIELLRRLAEKTLPPGRRDLFKRVVSTIAAPVALYFSYLAIARLADPLGADIVARTAFGGLARVVGWLSLGWFLWRLASTAADMAVEWLLTNNHPEGIGAVTLTSRLFRMTLLGIALAATMSSFGVDVTATLAALGFSGLALALGARKWVENVIGSISVIADKPIRVGDTCKFNGVIGEVVDIGLNSTRLRTRERTLLSIPNSQFSDGEIENLSLRDGFLVDQHFGIPLDVGTDRVELVLSSLRKCLNEFPDFFEGSASIRFLGFGESCLAFQIVGRIRCKSYAEGVKRQEELFLSVLRELDRLKVPLALPTRRLQLNVLSDETQIQRDA